MDAVSFRCPSFALDAVYIKKVACTSCLPIFIRSSTRGYHQKVIWVEALAR